MIRFKSLKTNSALWWFNPNYIYLLLFCLALYAVAMPEESYRNLYDVKHKVINSSHLILYAVSTLLFVIGVKMSRPPKYVGLDKCVYLEKTYKFLFILCMLAYTVWFGRFASFFGFKALFTFLSPAAMSDNMYVFRSSSGKIAGLTSMTELGPVLTPLAWLLYTYTHNNKYKRHLVVLFTLSIMRAVLFSERLAFLEIFVPMIVLYIAQKRYKKIFNYLPLLGFLGLYLVFAVFEFVRSWSTHYVYTYDGSFWQFSLDRLLGYYAIALNTECTALEYREPPYFPALLLRWLWKIPLMDQIPSNFGITTSYTNLLGIYGNEEFNNIGGMLTGINDFGLLGLVFYFFLGLFIGSFYKSFKSNSLKGYLLYPICVLCLFEMPRYFYWSDPRAFYTIIAMVVVYVSINRIRGNKRISRMI